MIWAAPSVPFSTWRKIAMATWRPGLHRKGYATLDDVRGLLSVPEDGSMRERRDYVAVLREANAGVAYGTW
jgi:hypothetical protein